VQIPGAEHCSRSLLFAIRTIVEEFVGHSWVLSAGRPRKGGTGKQSMPSLSPAAVTALLRREQAASARSNGPRRWRDRCRELIRDATSLTASGRAGICSRCMPPAMLARRATCAPGRNIPDLRVPGLAAATRRLQGYQQPAVRDATAFSRRGWTGSRAVSAIHVDPWAGWRPVWSG
jgi:hypothetical protein